MKIETPYEDITPEIDWGSCPGPECDGKLDWHEEGPICPQCGHLWDHKGADIGSWDENMGEPWTESRTYQQFRKAEADRRAWWDEIRTRGKVRAT